LRLAPRVEVASYRWSDGLPVVVAHDEAVSSMLGDRRSEAETAVGCVPPSFDSVTLRQLAEVAVQAGCRPRHLSILETALRCTLAADFNLLALQTTTEPSSVLVLVNGPARRTLPINVGSNVLGTSSAANAAIGRALRLALVRYGKATPGLTDMATFGHPGKLAYCIGEHEEASPWSPFHVERGYSPGDDVVTVVGADAPINVNCPGEDPDAILAMVALAMATPTLNNMLFGGEVMVVLSPEHAQALARAGLTKADVQRGLYERARVELSGLPPPVRRVLTAMRPALGEEVFLTAADSAASVLVLVAGGIGGHSTVIPTFGFTRAVSSAF
jgi:hypothetical protein